jgi:hypothetical protein
LNENPKETSKVQITKTTLRRIIKEELKTVMEEGAGYGSARETPAERKERIAAEKEAKKKADRARGSYYRHQPPDRPETYPGEFAARYMQEEGVLDDIVGRKPSGAPMTAQARQDILDGYVAFVQDKMPNVSPEDAVKSAIELFVAGGDPYLDPESDLFDQGLLDSLMSGE